MFFILIRQCSRLHIIFFFNTIFNMVLEETTIVDIKVVRIDDRRIDSFQVRDLANTTKITNETF